MLETLMRRLKTGEAVVGVMGLGYVGLPLVRAFSNGGLRCVGFDVDGEKVRQLMGGKSYIKSIPAAFIQRLVKKQRFEATTDFSRVGECDALVICVPTPLHKGKPDLSYVEKTAASVAKYLRKGQLVVLESTTYPGTTREVVLPALEKSGLLVGWDFMLAYSPERENPGSRDFETASIPKVVGGYNAGSLKGAAALYRCAVKEVVEVESMEVAEAAKILENCYRCINIAFINEFKMVLDRMGIDVWKVIEAAKTKPFGFQAFYPGPGMGGHCIPIDPFYLSWKARQYGVTAEFIELAGKVNVSMPAYVIGKVEEAVGKKKHGARSKKQEARRGGLRGKRVLVMGLAYKKDVDDLRESPSIVLIEELQRRGAKVDYNDPFIPTTHKQREHDLRMTSVAVTPARLKTYDVVVIATDHSVYDYGMIVKHSKVVVDTRNATGGVRVGREKIVKA